MSDTLLDVPRYFIGVRADHGGVMRYELAPRGVQAARGLGGAPPRVPSFAADVRRQGAGLQFDWSTSQDSPGDRREQLEDEIAKSLAAREAWTLRVTHLIEMIRAWVEADGWATKTLDKRLDDDWIGRHTVPALLMQRELCRVMVEPIGRRAPGAEGVVDLYLLPAYDDMATLTLDGEAWSLHHPYGGAEFAPGGTGLPQGVPLEQGVFLSALSEMQRHAASA